MDQLSLVLSDIKYKEELEEKMYFETWEEFTGYCNKVERN